MQSLRDHFYSLHRMAPANRDPAAAARLALSAAGPALVLLALGHPELTIYAVFGALTGMYGRTEPHQLRIRHQGQAAVLLIGGVAVGTMLSVLGLHSWWLAGVEAIFGALASLYSDNVDLRPNGPFFGILALGACASVPLTIPWTLAVLISITSACFAIVVGFGGWLRKRSWQPRMVRTRPDPSLSERRASLARALRYTLSISAAGTAGVLAGIGHPHWAMAAAAVPLSASNVPGAMHRGVHRIVGTFVGLVVVALLLVPGPLHVFPSSDAVALVLAIIVFAFTTELLMTRHYGLAMVSFTPVILLMTQLAFPEQPAVLIRDRGVETLIGASVGMVVALVGRHIYLRPRQRGTGH